MILLYSNDFYYFLHDIKNTNIIARFMLDYNGCLNTDLSFLSIRPDDKISFINQTNLEKLYKLNMSEKWNTLDNFVEYARTPNGPIYSESKFRTEIKIGRLIVKIFESEEIKLKFKNYASSGEWNGSFEKELEALTIEYKIRTKRIFDENFDSKLILLSGEDIRKYYNEEKYVKAENRASLHESCMRHARCATYLDIYVKNTDVCQMLVFKEEEEKISARALIWKLSNGKIYMDRIYTARYSDMRILTSYAQKNNWLSYDLGDANNPEISSQLVVNLTNSDFAQYPYMDTFTQLSVGTKRISKFSSILGDISVRRLRSQEGRWS